MGDIDERIQRLPQELCDQIYIDVFTPLSNRVEISHQYRVPALLHVSHDSRDVFATQYYSNHGIYFVSDDETLLFRWLRALPKHHLRMLREVRLINQSLMDAGITRYIGPNSRFNVGTRKDFAWTAGEVLRRSVNGRLENVGLELREGVLRVEQHFINEAERVDVVVC